MASYTTGFSGGNENPLSESGKWTTGQGSYDTVQVSSGIVTDTGGSESVASYTAVSIGNDQYAQVDVQIDFANRKAGPAVRVSTSDGSHYSFNNVQGSPGDYEIVEHASNTAATRIGAAYTGETSTYPVTLKLTISGSTLTPYINGVAKATRSDSTHASGQPGLFISSPDQLASVDNFDGGDLTAAVSGTARGRSLLQHAHAQLIHRF